MMYSTDKEILEIVDENDTVIGTATREEIHRFGYLHRSVHVFVFDHKGRLFVQRRSATKDRHPLKLDSSAAGHVDPGESYFDAAKRELFEELGITDGIEHLLNVAACDITDNEHVGLFAAFTDAIPQINESEVLSGSFMSPDELELDIESNSSDYVPAFVHLWIKFRQSGSLQSQTILQLEKQN